MEFGHLLLKLCRAITSFSKNVTFYQAYVKSQQALFIVQNKWRSTISQQYSTAAKHPDSYIILSN